MNCNANHLINAAQSLSAYDAAPIFEVFALSAGDPAGWHGQAQLGRGHMAHIARDPQQMTTIARG